MRSAACAIIVTSGVVGLFGSALAADMTGAEIKAFLSDKTAYLETTAASASGQPGQGIIYWAADGTALYKTPSGSIMHGKWEIKGNTNCADWKERPGSGCVRYDKSGETVTVIDVNSGQTRAKIVKTAPGTPKNWHPEPASYGLFARRTVAHPREAGCERRRRSQPSQARVHRDSLVASRAGLHVRGSSQRRDQTTFT